MRLISDINHILAIIQGKADTNCFLLPNEIEQLFIKGSLRCYQEGENTILLQDKSTHKRLYYFISDMENLFELPNDYDYLCDIVYRGEKRPVKEIAYLQEIGFEERTLRSIYQLIYKDAPPYTMRSGCEVRYAKSLDEVEEACSLFNATFDNITGDYISTDEYEGLLKGNYITVAIDENGKIAGAYQHDCIKNVAWGRHLAVQGGYRGRSVGKDLLYDYIERYHAQRASRYMLWCTVGNEAAVKMYESTGFKTIGRHCVSLVRKANTQRHNKKNIENMYNNHSGKIPSGGGRTHIQKMNLHKRIDNSVYFSIVSSIMATA